LLLFFHSNFLFQHLNAVQRQTVVGLMRPLKVKEGEWVIRQGDAGDKFYIVDSGRFEVRVKSWAFPTEHDVHLDMDDDEREQAGGVVVHVYESGPEQHPGFGELSLMYGKPRAASVIALEDGLLWALDRRVFKRVVLRPRDMRRDVIRILKKVELFKCLNVTQLQRLTDLLNERSFLQGEHIITQGEEGTSFYIIVSGTCDCSINQVEGPPKIVMQLKEYDYFGERALLESKPRAANVVATRDTKCLYIEKQAFEEVLGPLAQIIEEDQAKREALAALTLSAPQTFDDLSLTGVALTDTLGPLLLGSFGPATAATTSSSSSATAAKKVQTLTVRSVLLSEVSKTASADAVVRFIEVAKLLRHNNHNNHNNSSSSSMLPSCLAILRQSNAVHLVFSAPIVSDLSSFIRTYASKLSLAPLTASSSSTPASPSSPATASSAFLSATVTAATASLATAQTISPFLVHSFACIASAVEALHDVNVVYRAIQPESVYVDARGQIVLMDYRFCKIGLVQGSGSKAFTICGASDYLSPEQIAQTGHSFPVDFWGMGVLLYELAVGAHPFSSTTEVATYSKIASFGSKTFPALKFPETINVEVKALINQLLVPTPEARIGIAALKKHPFFESFSAWETLGSSDYVSPTLALAALESDEIAKEGIDQSMLDSFTAKFDEPVAWLNVLDA
jgi:cAMP-dependent protein kinase regulator